MPGATPRQPGFYEDVPAYAGPTYASSPAYSYPATDRDRAIARLSMLCGDPLRPPEIREEKEAREFFKIVMQTDPDLRKTTEYVKDIVTSPDGEARLWREVMVPELLQQMRYEGGKFNYDKFNSPWFAFPERFVTFNRPSFGSWAEFDEHMQSKNLYWKIGVYTLAFMTICWFRRKCYFWSPTALVTAKYSRLSRRYYGKTFDKIPPTPVYLRNEISKQAITQKMIRDGRAWSAHVNSNLWMSRGQATPKPVIPEWDDFPKGLTDGAVMK